MIMPKFHFQLPQDYAALTFAMTLLLGGGVGRYVIGNGFGLLLGALLVFGVMWVIGFFMGRIDPEFFGVWRTNKTQISDTMSGKRSYEP